MIDLTQIKAQYAAMTNGELENLLLQADTLRRDAFLALKQECRKRNILSGLMQQADAAMVDGKIERIRENISKEQKKWWAGVLAFAFEQKFNDASNDTILAGLLGMHASLEEALYVENNLEELAGKALADAATDRISGITKALCGTAVIIIVHLASLRNNVMIYGGIIMVAGLVQIANSASRKSRYQTILYNIQNQKTEPGNDDTDLPDDSLLIH